MFDLFEEAGACLVLLAELGVEVGGLRDGAEDGEDAIEVGVGEGRGRLVAAKGADVEFVAEFVFGDFGGEIGTR